MSRSAVVQKPCDRATKGWPRAIHRNAVIVWIALVSWVQAEDLPVMADWSDKELERQGEIWRVAARDGANCLYTLLTARGVPVEYTSVVRDIEAKGERSRSLSGLTEMANQAGACFSTVNTDIAGLDGLSLPILLHLDPQRGSIGEFVLLIQRIANPEPRWVVFRGGSATIQMIPDEEFRRRWSGYAIVDPRNPNPSCTAANILMATSFFYWLFQLAEFGGIATGVKRLRRSNPSSQVRPVE